MDVTFWQSDIFTYFLLPFLIFLARIVDVSAGTLRIILLSKGKKLFAPMLGFFEVLIWIIAISKILENSNNWVCYIAYAIGFATGNYIGIIIEEKLALGVVIVRIITKADVTELSAVMREAGFGFTTVDAKGQEGSVNILFTVIQRNEVPKLTAIIRIHQPSAFYSIEDVRMVKQIAAPIGRKIGKK